MTAKLVDWKVILGVILAAGLYHFAFDYNKVFWYLYTAVSLFLISYAILLEEMDHESEFMEDVLWGISSGVGLYGMFSAGHWLLGFLPGHLDQQVSLIYAKLSVDLFWHHLVLFFIIVPGEEIFWRGFVQKRLESLSTPLVSVMLTSSLSGVAFFFSGYPVLAIAAFFSGLIWGTLYIWKRSMPLLIISHLVFDILLLIVWPLS